MELARGAVILGDLAVMANGPVRRMPPIVSLRSGRTRTGDEFIGCMRRNVCISSRRKFRSRPLYSPSCNGHGDFACAPIVREVGSTPTLISLPSPTYHHLPHAACPSLDPPTPDTMISTPFSTIWTVGIDFRCHPSTVIQESAGLRRMS